MTPEDGQGIHIRLLTSSTGFLGSRSALERDLAVIGFFSVAWLLLFSVIRPGAASIPEAGDHSLEESGTGPSLGMEGSNADSEELDRVRAASRGWALRFRTLVAGFGGGTRDLIKQGRSLQETNRRSQRNIANLRNQIHSQVNDLSRSRKRLHEVVQAISRSGTATGETYPLLEEALAIVQACERRMEPCAADADQVFHAQAEAARIADAMNRSVNELTENLILQAKHLKDLNSALAPSSVTDSRESA